MAMFLVVFLFLFQHLPMCVAGDSSLLLVPGWEGGGDPQKVQGHHQDLTVHSRWQTVCTVWQ